MCKELGPSRFSRGASPDRGPSQHVTMCSSISRANRHNSNYLLTATDTNAESSFIYVVDIRRQYTLSLHLMLKVSKVLLIHT